MPKTPNPWHVAQANARQGRGSFLDIKAENRCGWCGKPRATWMDLDTGLKMCEPCGDRLRVLPM